MTAERRLEMKDYLKNALAPYRRKKFPLEYSIARVLTDKEMFQINIKAIRMGVDCSFEVYAVTTFITFG